MNVRRLARAPLMVALALLAQACGDETASGVALPFTRPEHVEFACYAPLLSSPNDYVVLPRKCCAAAPPDARECREAVANVGGAQSLMQVGTPAPHALVSQTTRGEIAAVDLTRGIATRVLDSDRAVPGFTFIDSGGLPTAIVVPPRHPRVPAGVDPEIGPKWTYVASAEQYEVRAIATCRFRSGAACGPELAGSNRQPGSGLLDRLRVPLPAAPADMVLGPDEALWVTLPDRALIARIELAEHPADRNADPTDAFALDPATGRPKEPMFFSVPMPADVAPPEPVAEEALYAAQCTATPPPVQSRTLPRAPVAPMPPVLAPTQLRFEPTDPANPSAGGLLLVGDASAPVIHVFSIGGDGSLTAQSALPTGAPLRAFVLTPPVPARVPERRPYLDNPSLLAAREASDARYLYAVDDRDGSMMLFSYALDGTAPRLTPLLSPAPGVRFKDRLDLPAPTAALEVIDTRSVSPIACMLPGQPEYTALRTLHDNAGPRFLRGVFLVAASTQGTLSVLDIQDLDIACRDDKTCQPPPAEGRRDGNATDVLSLRRHASRFTSMGQVEAPFISASALAPTTCPADYVSIADVDGAARVCVPRDPWSAVNEVWRVRYHDVLPGSLSYGGALERVAGRDDQLIVRAPAGIDLCGRGVQPRDVVAIIGQPPERLRNVCPDVGVGSEGTRLEVVEAHRDHLIVQAQATSTGMAPGMAPDPATAASERAARHARLLDCYPDLVSYEVRAADYLVVGSLRGYLHNIHANADGVCEPNPELDARLTARAVEGQVFTNPYVSFMLSQVPGRVGGADTTVQVRGGGEPFASNLVTAQQGDALTAQIRYFPERGELFLLDTASQGLRRYTLWPFQREADR